MDALCGNDPLPTKSQLHFTLRPLFNLIVVVIVIILHIWSNYLSSKFLRFPSLATSIMIGVLSFIFGLLLGTIGGRWQMQFLKEEWNQIRGIQSVFYYKILKRNKWGRKARNYSLMILLPTFAVSWIIGFFSIDYGFIIITFYFSYFYGFICGFHCLPLYLWSRKLPA